MIFEHTYVLCFAIVTNNMCDNFSDKANRFGYYTVLAKGLRDVRLQYVRGTKPFTLVLYSKPWFCVKCAMRICTLFTIVYIYPERVGIELNTVYHSFASNPFPVWFHCVCFA